MSFLIVLSILTTCITIILFVTALLFLTDTTTLSKSISIPSSFIVSLLTLIISVVPFFICQSGNCSNIIWVTLIVFFLILDLTINIILIVLSRRKQEQKETQIQTQVVQQTVQQSKPIIFSVAARKPPPKWECPKVSTKTEVSADMNYCLSTGNVYTNDCYEPSQYGLTQKGTDDEFFIERCKLSCGDNYTYKGLPLCDVAAITKANTST